MALKYKAGDRVRIKSLDWYNDNKNNKGIIVCGSESFTHPMSHFCDKIVTIVTIQDNCYRTLEDDGDWYWTDEMIEGLVDEEKLLCEGCCSLELKYNKLTTADNICTDKVEIILQDYELKKEGDKWFAVKKKKEYPKTYEECINILGGAPIIDINTYYYEKQLKTLYKLLICRDAYWKIAGEEMGLGKPWELSIGTPIYYIYYNRTLGTIKKDYADDIQGNVILAFPTEEMRDAFYENFKELIETVKELL